MNNEFGDDLSWNGVKKATRGSSVEKTTVDQEVKSHSPVEMV